MKATNIKNKQMSFIRLTISRMSNNWYKFKFEFIYYFREKKAPIFTYCLTKQVIENGQT